MSDDLDFLLRAGSLGSDFGTRFKAQRLGKTLKTILGALCLTALALLLVLTDTTGLVISLSILGLIIFELVRWGIKYDRQDSRKTSQ